MPRVHYVDMKSIALQNLEKSDPINSRCLHDDGLYAACLQPLRHAMEVGREASECSDWLGISPFGHRNIMLRIANVNSSRIPIQCREPFVQLSLAFAFCFRWLGHL